jgi:hypothetical protein
MADLTAVVLADWRADQKVDLKAYSMVDPRAAHSASCSAD